MFVILVKESMNAESAAGRDELFDSAKPQHGRMLTDRQTEKQTSPSTLIYILYARKIHPTSYIHSCFLNSLHSSNDALFPLVFDSLQPQEY